MIYVNYKLATLSLNVNREKRNIQMNKLNRGEGVKNKTFTKKVSVSAECVHLSLLSIKLKCDEKNEKCCESNIDS